MVREKINFWIGVPTMYWSILKYVEETGFDPSAVVENLKVPTSGGAPMPVELIETFLYRSHKLNAFGYIFERTVVR